MLWCDFPIRLICKIMSINGGWGMGVIGPNERQPDILDQTFPKGF